MPKKWETWVQCSPQPDGVQTYVFHLPGQFLNHQPTMGHFLPLLLKLDYCAAKNARFIAQGNKSKSEHDFAAMRIFLWEVNPTFWGPTPKAIDAFYPVTDEHNAQKQTLSMATGLGPSEGFSIGTSNLWIPIKVWHSSTKIVAVLGMHKKIFLVIQEALLAKTWVSRDFPMLKELGGGFMESTFGFR